MDLSKTASILAVASLALAANAAHAFGNACKNVNFSVDNNYDRPVTVTKVELWSQSEGRWLSDDFKNVLVPKGARDFVVRKGENVEHAENDRITKIRYHYQYEEWGPMGEIPMRKDTIKYTSTDDSIADPVCGAGRWYKGTINAEPDTN
jgi:hypothetical protein